MKRYGFTAVVVLLSLVITAPSFAQTNSNIRLLLHGKKQVGKAGFGISGWVVAPNITNAPDKWVSVIGPRYDGNGWWLESMAGTVVQQGTSTPLFDFRTSLSKFSPFTAWSNIQWIDFTKGTNSSFYGYLQLDYTLSGGIALVGLETENVLFREGKDMLSVGPHIIVPFNYMVIAMVYQFHKDEDNQFWTRMVVNF